MGYRITLAVALVAIAACGPGGDSEMVSLILPEGEVAAGELAFVNLRCHACHRVSGSPDLPPLETDKPGPDLGLSLKGVSRGAIASSIIAPQHVNVEEVEMWTDLTAEERIWLGPAQLPPRSEAERLPSRMREYTAVMTVRELTDLVSYLHSSASVD